MKSHTTSASRQAPRILRGRRFAAAAAAALCACAVAGSAALAQDSRSEPNAFTWSGEVPQARWIMIRNLNGPIHVERTTGNRVEVVADRRTRRGDPEYVRFEVKRFGAGDQDVLVCAIWGEESSCNENGYDRPRRSGRNRNNDVRVEFRVRVPNGVKVAAHGVNGEVSVEGATAEVDASSVNGSVYATSSGGPVSASSVNGSVHATMGNFELRDDLEFSSVNGSVIAEFAGDLNAEVSLHTVNGRFVTDFPVTIRGRIDPRRLNATLGKGGPRIRLSTVNGNVELRKR